MNQKFDPAAHDKHAANPKEAVKADSKTHSELEAGLVGSFPASDPASSVQPSTVESGAKSDKTKNDKTSGSKDDPSLIDKLREAIR